jgi:hypothetical protein
VIYSAPSQITARTDVPDKRKMIQQIINHAIFLSVDYLTLLEMNHLK